MTSLLTPLGWEFVTARHLATLSTLSKDGSPHVIPVGFTVEGDLARVITNVTSQKVRNLRRDGRAAISQVDGREWLTFSGTAQILDGEDDVAHAVELYSRRYRQPQPNPQRVAIVLTITRIMGTPAMIAG